MASVRSVRQAIEFYRKLGFEPGHTQTPGYVLMISHT
jgi:hypothetical protein